MATQTNTLTWIKEKFKNERPLSLAEEHVLFEEIKKGNVHAKVRVLCANMKFVIQVASNYKNNTLSQEDLINEGAIGLWRALESFDHTRGVRFLTYAVWWIKAFIARAISEKGSLIRLPLNQQARLHKANAKSKQGDALDADVEELNNICATPCSLDSNLPDHDSLKLEDIIVDRDAPSVEQPIEDSFREKYTQWILDHLPPRERQTLEHLSGINTNAKSIRGTSAAMGISRERVRQLRNQGFKRLQNLNYDGHLNKTLQDLFS